MSPKSGRSYHEILPYLSNKERIVIAPDYPGHGESSLPPSDPHVTIEDFSEAIWCVVDDLIGEVRKYYSVRSPWDFSFIVKKIAFLNVPIRSLSYSPLTVFLFIKSNQNLATLLAPID